MSDGPAAVIEADIQARVEGKPLSRAAIRDAVLQSVATLTPSSSIDVREDENGMPIVIPRGD